MPSFLSPARFCDVDGQTLPADTDATQSQSSCDAGPAFTCIDHAPVADPVDDRIAYAFAATPGTDAKATCGTCFNVTFPGSGYYSADDAGSKALAAQGKTLLVQATNIGHDVAAQQFDLLIPVHVNLPRGATDPSHQATRP